MFLSSVNHGEIHRFFGEGVNSVSQEVTAQLAPAKIGGWHFLGESLFAEAKLLLVRGSVTV